MVISTMSVTLYCYYETGRHLTSVGPYVVASIDAIQTMWLDQNLVMRDIVRIGNITLDNANSVAVATTALAFQIIDMRPSTSGVLVAAYKLVFFILSLLVFSVSIFCRYTPISGINGEAKKLLLYRVLHQSYRILLSV